MSEERRVFWMVERTDLEGAPQHYLSWDCKADDPGAQWVTDYKLGLKFYDRTSADMLCDEMPFHWDVAIREHMETPAQAAPVADAPGMVVEEPKADSNTTATKQDIELIRTDLLHVLQHLHPMYEKADALCDLAIKALSQPPQSVKEIVENLRGFRSFDGKRFVFILDDDQAAAEIESHVQERLRDETEKREKLQKALEQAVKLAEIELIKSERAEYVMYECGQDDAADNHELAAYLRSRSTPDSKGDV